MEGTAISSQSFTGSKGTIHYLSAGPETGPLIIFVHGCPFPAITWRPQLQCFASLGFRVVAADTTGYGDSYNSADVADYSMESQVSDQLELLSHVGREKAVFIGHDWGSAIVWSIAAHHQDKCLGVAALGIPYRTVELGLEKLVATVDRDLYPEDKYPYGQWDYMVYYNQNTKDVEAYHAEHGDRLAKLFTMPYDGPIPPVQTPAATANLTKSGGFFGGQAPPDVPLEASLLDAAMYEAVIASPRKHGTFGQVAYYRNDAANAAYNDAKNCPNGAKLDVPCFYLDCSADLCSVSNCSPAWTADMRELCSNLFEAQLVTRHMVALEKSNETNALLARWLCERTEAWPVDRSSGRV